MTNTVVFAEGHEILTASLTFDDTLLATGEPVDIIVSPRSSNNYNDETALSVIFRREDGDVFDAPNQNTSCAAVRAIVPSNGIYRVRGRARDLDNTMQYADGVRFTIALGGHIPATRLVQMNYPVPAGVQYEASLEGDRLWLKAGEVVDAVVDPEGQNYCDSTGLGLCYECEGDGTASVVNVDFTGTESGAFSAARGREGYSDWLTWNALNPGGAAGATAENCYEADRTTRRNVSVTLARTFGAAIATGTAATGTALAGEWKEPGDRQNPEAERGASQNIGSRAENGKALRPVPTSDAKHLSLPLGFAETPGFEITAGESPAPRQGCVCAYTPDVLAQPRLRGVMSPGGYDASHEANMFHDARFADHFVELWRRIARRFKGREGIYGYDLVNEPLQAREAAPGCEFPTLMRRAAEAVRAEDPATPVIVESNHCGSPAFFADLEPLPLVNVIYHAFREWAGWSVEHEGEDDASLRPSADNPRKQALVEGFRRH